MMEDVEEKLLFLLRTSPYISLAGTYSTYARAVRELIANGVVVREKGEWIGKEEKLWNLEQPLVTAWECSKCGVFGHYTQDFCPNCGADMRKGESDGV